LIPVIFLCMAGRVLVTIPAEKREAVEDLQMRLATTYQTIEAIKTNLYKTSRDKRVSEILQTELKSLPDSSRCYSSVGRMFVLTPRTDLIKKAETTSESADKESKVLQDRLKQLTLKQQELQREFSETVKQAMQRSAQSSH